MLVYRIEREKYLSDTLKGFGAATSAAFRWNSQYTRMVYTSQSRSLATLEVSVHLDLASDLPNDRYFVEIEIPDDLLILDLGAESLPPNWDSRPPIKATQLIGDAFIQHTEAAVLRVPSVIVPKEYNLLINPLHPAATRITVLSHEPMNFDSRFR